MATLTASEFRGSVANVLGQVQVTIGAPFGYVGNYWNSGEEAWVRVRVENTTGSPLRDVAVKLRATWGGRYPTDTTVIATWLDGISVENTDTIILGDMEPNDERLCYFRLRAGSAGSRALTTIISAEVVPYAAYHKGWQTVNIVGA